MLDHLIDPDPPTYAEREAELLTEKLDRKLSQIASKLNRAYGIGLMCDLDEDEDGNCEISVQFKCDRTPRDVAHVLREIADELGGGR